MPNAGFAPHHRWDRNFFLLMVATIWLGVLMGFVPEIIAHVRDHKPGYPIVVHIHALAFVGWLILLTTQVLLVRARRTDIHRRLGVVGMVLAPTMVVLGAGAAIVTDYRRFGTPDSDPAFLAIQIGDLISFGVLAAAAFLTRATPTTHKRLILLATFFIADAGFARWWGDGLKSLGGSFWAVWAQNYLDGPLLVAALAGYDWITRRRIHPAVIAGGAFGLGMQLLINWLYVSPWWKPIATHLIGR
jgi:hypothetical protein